MKRRWTYRLLVITGILILLVLALVLTFNLITRIDYPVPQDERALQLKVENPEPDFFTIGPNWLKKSESGLWEMYIEGKPFDRGVINGKLSRSLIEFQEQAFIDRIRQIIPSDAYLRFLKYAIYWFNRDLDQHIPEEFRLEIFGISFAASDRFSFIGNAYQRILNYHSAHDIGHALQDLSMVGCTSFSVRDGMSSAQSLLIGRNFDFYSGDDFAKNKIILFEKPDNGHAFMMITWGGMVGAVSGMNEQGLTVTINAAKSKIPGSARTPISILTREILQYASTIREAYAIASKREIFVSESILVGSDKDNATAIIEKSPDKMALVMTQNDYITCTNHFQSKIYANDPRAAQDRRESPSVYRQRRLVQLINDHSPLTVEEMALILRDRQGLNGKEIGMGNEKAVNQLIAHHSVIFMPRQRLVWVSTQPWQLGSYVCYDLYKIFRKFAGLQHKIEITETDLSIAPDPFLESGEYHRFVRFLEIRNRIRSALRSGNVDLMTRSFMDQFRATNPLSFEVYELAGDIFYKKHRWNDACHEYRHALRLEIPRWQEKERIIKKLADCEIKESCK
ncbi:MAG: peptidase C45 [Alphaproteobacteria bacterium]|nr:peptidase C45 [Alphaproteobacteria bacterium]